MTKWTSGYKVTAFASIDSKQICFNVQYFAPGQSVNRPPIWDKTVYVENSDMGRHLVFDFTDSLCNYVAALHIPNNAEVFLANIDLGLYNKLLEPFEEGYIND